MASHQRSRALQNGLLFYDRRTDDQINLFGDKLAAEGLERDLAVLVTTPPAQYANTSYQNDLRGEGVLLAYEVQVSALAEVLEAGLRQILSAKGIRAGSVVRTMQVDALPCTDGNKVRRAALRDQ